MLTSLAGIAGIGGVGGATPLELSRRLLLDPQVLQATLGRPVFGSSAGATLQEVLGRGDVVSGSDRVSAAKYLRSRLRVGVDIASQSVTVSLTLPDSALVRPALDLVVAVVDSVHRFTQERQAGAMRRFMEEQVRSARAQALASERVLEQFLEANRTLGSPRLQLEVARLQRVAEMDRQWTQTLEIQLAQSMLAEARNTPTLVAAIPPDDPLVRDASRLRSALLVSLVLLLASGAAHAWRESLATASVALWRRSPDSVAS